MQYARIIALIDADLERLQKARQLLAASTFVQPRKPQKRKSLPSTQPEAPKPEPASESSSAPGRSKPRTHAVPRKRLREVSHPKRPSIRMSEVATVERPLAGVIPVAPVFVPAKQVHQTLTQKEQLVPLPESPLGSASNEVVTAELLAQRWLRNSVS